MIAVICNHRGGYRVERKKFRDYLLLGSALLGVWFLLQRFDALTGFVKTQKTRMFSCALIRARKTYGFLFVFY